jgi:hypothetical protein
MDHAERAGVRMVRERLAKGILAADEHDIGAQFTGGHHRTGYGMLRGMITPHRINGDLQSVFVLGDHNAALVIAAV